jgi:hypothetical protein
VHECANFVDKEKINEEEIELLVTSFADYLNSKIQFGWGENFFDSPQNNKLPILYEFEIFDENTNSIEIEFELSGILDNLPISDALKNKFNFEVFDKRLARVFSDIDEGIFAGIEISAPDENRLKLVKHLIKGVEVD